MAGFGFSFEFPNSIFCFFDLAWVDKEIEILVWMDTSQFSNQTGGDEARKSGDEM